jgi:Domain of unknown function (DUF4386)
MTDISEPSPQRLAQAAGVLYLMTIISGVFAEVFVRGALVVPSDAAATARNISNQDTLYRFGLTADLVMIACYAGVTILLYRLLRRFGRELSLIAASFSLIGLSVLAVNTLNHAAPLLLLQTGRRLDAFTPEQVQALALVCLRMHSRAYTVSSIFFGVYCMIIGYLALLSRVVLRAVGILMIAGGTAYFANGFLVFLSPRLSALLPDVTIFGGLAELSLTLWLIVRGGVVSWERHAGVAATSRWSDR